MLQRLLEFQKKHGNDPTEFEKNALVVHLEENYSDAAPFLWKTIESELADLRIGMC